MKNNSRKCKNLLILRNLRLSLKYRPEILKLILKMRQTIRMKNALLKSLRHKLGTNVAKIVISPQTESNIDDNEKIYFEKNTEINVPDLNHLKDTSTQTRKSYNCNDKSDKHVKDSYIQTEDVKIINCLDENTSKIDNVLDKVWEIQDSGETNKSIAEQVKEVAQSAIQETGMVYVESAGMYYDYKTGYYYHSELGLYYHPDTGCYYYYSDDKKSLVFYSYPDKSAENESLKAHERRKAKKHKKAAKSDNIENLTKQFNQDNEESKPKRIKTSKKIKKTEDLASEKDEAKKNEMDMDELEDGECSDSASESDDNISTSTATDDESVAKRHPPCMRIIVRETNLPKLKVGTLYLITKDGGSLGREGEHHAIILRDHNVSRNHLCIKYDMDRRMYTAVDIGSKNGTILNGIRMSETKQMSGAMEIVHGSIIQLGETKLLCHIHAGNDTCGHCEPGLIMETQEKEKVAYTRSCSVQKQHQLELARLKNKYAPQPLAIEETAYNDRAQARREKVGSSHNSEKTQSSDINTFIAEENKGFKLLEKMGWSKGEGLGKDSQGDTEPIPLVSNEGKTGLGAESVPVVLKASKILGRATLRLAARTKMLEPPAKAFQEPMEEDL